MSTLLNFIQEIAWTFRAQRMSRYPSRQPHRGGSFAATAERHFRSKHYG
jgi:hypothetical protein